MHEQEVRPRRCSPSAICLLMSNSRRPALRTGIERMRRRNPEFSPVPPCRDRRCGLQALPAATTARLRTRCGGAARSPSRGTELRLSARRRVRSSHARLPGRMARYVLRPADRRAPSHIPYGGRRPRRDRILTPSARCAATVHGGILLVQGRIGRSPDRRPSIAQRRGEPLLARAGPLGSSLREHRDRPEGDIRGSDVRDLFDEVPSRLLPLPGCAHLIVLSHRPPSQ
jgi:hypothetical protein